MFGTRVREGQIEILAPGPDSFALGIGTFSVHSPAGRGTTVSCQLPVNADGEQ